MKPTEIIPETGEEIPSERNKLRDIIREYDVDNEISGENVIYLKEKNMQIRLENSLMDFDKGQEILKIRIENPYIQTVIFTQEIFVSDVRIAMYGYYRDEQFEIYP
jgi:hypothetical protein